MKITNKFGLPQTLVNYWNADTYSRGDAKISVTQLIDSPKIKILKEKHQDEIELDVSESLWALIGKALHHIAEQGADSDHIAEERLFADIHGWRLSGAIDLQKRGDLVGIRDYKFTSVYAATSGKPEWERQANVYSWLAKVSKGWDTSDLQICAFLRDWSRLDAKRDSTYPQAPVKIFTLPLWSFDDQQKYVEERMKLHQEAWRKEEWGDELPLCTREERWMRPAKWAVKKDGNTRASVVYADHGKAKAYLGRYGAGYVIEYREGEAIRCAEYCSAAPWCSQFQSGLKIKSKASGGLLDDE